MLKDPAHWNFDQGADGVWRRPPRECPTMTGPTAVERDAKAKAAQEKDRQAREVIAQAGGPMSVKDLARKLQEGKAG
jgi:hypothetical protein